MAAKILSCILEHSKDGSSEFNRIVNELSVPNIPDADLYLYLSGLKEGVSHLGKEDKLFAHLLKIEWHDREMYIVQEFHRFVLNFVIAHPRYLKTSLKPLIKGFFPKRIVTRTESGVEEAFVENEQLSQATHDLMKLFLKFIPLSAKDIASAVGDCFPYANKHAVVQRIYVTNLLRMTSYFKSQRVKILSIIVDRLLKIDVRASRIDLQEAEQDCETSEDIFSLDSDDKDRLKGQMRHPDGHKLDVMMHVLLTYIHNTCHKKDVLDWAETRALYKELLTVFDQVVLPTHACSHVQFYMFYICSFRRDLYIGFVDYLWKKVVDPNVSSVLRQSAVHYIGSLLARALYISPIFVRSTMEELVVWIHKYVRQATDLRPDSSIHAPFYSVCQTLFYLFVFRHKEVLALDKGLQFCQSLNLQSIVTCRLNPIRFCLPLVAKTFSCVTRTHQIAFCDTVIEHNKRCSLPVSADDDAYHFNHFFPFDPFLLLRSQSFIISLYREYDEPLNPEDEDADLSTESVDQEELMEQGGGSLIDDAHIFDEDLMTSKKASTSRNAAIDLLNYGSSPGFSNGSIFPDDSL